MKCKKLIVALALGGLVSAAQAGPWLGSFNTGSTSDGVLNNMSGFDFYPDGSAAIFSITDNKWLALGDNIDDGDQLLTYYQGIANAVTSGVPAGNLKYPGSVAGLVPGIDYEITVAALIYETVISSTATSLTLTTTAGQVSVFFDDTPDAIISSGTGFTNGVVIATGNMYPFPLSPNNTINYSLTEISGNVTIVGDAPCVKTGTVAPDVVGFLAPIPNGYNASTTIQFGNQGTGYQTNSFFDGNTDACGNNWAATAVPLASVIRADGNVNFQLNTVPEPTALALFGISMVGLGLTRRRRSV